MAIMAAMVVMAFYGSYGVLAIMAETGIMVSYPPFRLGFVLSDDSRTSVSNGDLQTSVLAALFGLPSPPTFYELLTTNLTEH